jgi:hypothetical protein
MKAIYFIDGCLKWSMAQLIATFDLLAQSAPAPIELFVRESTAAGAGWLPALGVFCF